MALTRPAGVDPVPEREQLGARVGRVHEGRRSPTASRNVTARTHGEVVKTYKARRTFKEMAKLRGSAVTRASRRHDHQPLAHAANTGPINASNPCSEYMRSTTTPATSRAQPHEVPRQGRQLDVEASRRGRRHVLVQEIVVGNAPYPTPEIEKHENAYRQLGLGYANLGALFMATGCPMTPTRPRVGCCDHLADDRTAFATPPRSPAGSALRRLPANAAPMLGVMAQHALPRDLQDWTSFRPTCCRHAARHGTTS